jgi:hypothetical protein
MTSIAGVKLRAIVRRILHVEFQTGVEPFHLRLDQKKNGRVMSVDNREWSRMLGLNPMPPWAEVWHLWKLVIPRRSITGGLLRGQVWRRHDGRRWIYKPFTEYTG